MSAAAAHPSVAPVAKTPTVRVRSLIVFLRSMAQHRTFRVPPPIGITSTPVAEGDGERGVSHRAFLSRASSACLSLSA